MGLKDSLARLFGRSPEQKIKKLLQQMEQAMNDLKMRVADSVAESSNLQRQITQASEQRDKSPAANEGSQAAFETKILALTTALQAEQQAEARLRQIYEDLSNRHQLLEITYNQSLGRLRNAELKNLLTKIYQDFGNDMQLNRYLEKFSEDSFKIEFTADSQLKIEMMLEKAKL